MSQDITTVDRIRVLAKGKGMSLPVLESTLGLGNGTVSRWNKSAPNTDKLSKVADYFHVSIDYLLGREQNKTLPECECGNSDERIVILNRGAKNMSIEQRQKLLDMAKVMFEEEFRGL